MKKLNKHSHVITQDNSQPAAQAMLYAIGFSDEDFEKPLIGIASTGYEGNPCNMHLNKLALDVKSGVESIDYVGLIFNTIGVSDGISMGTPAGQLRPVKELYWLLMQHKVSKHRLYQIYIWL